MATRLSLFAVAWGLLNSPAAQGNWLKHAIVLLVRTKKMPSFSSAPTTRRRARVNAAIPGRRDPERGVLTRAEEGQVPENS
jgi:hypothetical protein